MFWTVIVMASNKQARFCCGNVWGTFVNVMYFGVNYQNKKRYLHSEAGYEFLDVLSLSNMGHVVEYVGTTFSNPMLRNCSLHISWHFHARVVSDNTVRRGQ